MLTEQVTVGEHTAQSAPVHMQYSLVFRDSVLLRGELAAILRKSTWTQR